ncbi:amidohydrolase [Phenylobacterium hankyongense]|uniref:Amidohydrolase n=1 Tax=Phenylobacterium hankyongense TaxID=1813876 RepID=A0A328B4B3_9CAUL|nr:amidohydrolase [Phenylobacterium hankyongense]RAK60694.1 amidohydrolase [Phenylobacterium hankyongense]
MKKSNFRLALMSAAVTVSLAVVSQAAAKPLSDADRGQILKNVDADAPQISDAALKIWGFAEVGYQEVKSSAVLQQQLKAAGFDVKSGVAGMPTAFIGSFKNGPGPVVAILAEFDALPGLAQTASPVKTPIAGQIAGHGCGHNLFGAASVGAAVAIKEWMVKNNVKGELRLYGSPAEEGGSGKVYLVRAGLFNDVDAALHWHPGNENTAVQGVSMANISGKFRFHGRSSHAAGAPEKGRSALDGVEVMDVATNFLREHTPDKTRIHYVITSGGGAPNVVPDFAEVYYYVRHPDPAVVRDVWDRVHKAADGAALATGTTVDMEITGGVYALLPNDTLGRVMDANLRRVGGISWTPEEVAFGKKLQESMPGQQPSVDSVKSVVPYKVEMEGGGGSTDVSDISWTTPTVGLSTATFVPGSAGHSWQNVAAAGSSIGIKGAVNAAKTLALTGADLFANPDVIKKAKAELDTRRGPNFTYKAMLGDRPPALDYRKSGAGGQ